MTNTNSKAPTMHCRLCGQNVHKIAERGAYLKRTSPIGTPFIGECYPSCDGEHGDQDDALIAAIEGNLGG
jgi:hypothetical protein